MDKILYLRADKLANLGELVQALHSYFSAEKKLNKENENVYGVSFPEFNDANSGTLIGVHNLSMPETLLTFMPIMRLLVSHRIHFKNIIELTSTEHYSFAAFIRDRKLERGAPPRAMARATQMKNKKSTDQKTQYQMKRYFDENLPKITMKSGSNGRNFTLRVNKLNSGEATSIESVKFNSYGLSTYESPMFLPIPEKQIR